MTKHSLICKEVNRLTIALGSDHGGFALKQAMIAHLQECGVDYKDFGVY